MDDGHGMASAVELGCAEDTAWRYRSFKQSFLHCLGIELPPQIHLGMNPRHVKLYVHDMFINYVH